MVAKQHVGPVNILKIIRNYSIFVKKSKNAKNILSHCVMSSVLVKQI